MAGALKPRNLPEKPFEGLAQSIQSNQRGDHDVSINTGVDLLDLYLLLLFHVRRGGMVDAVDVSQI